MKTKVLLAVLLGGIMLPGLAGTASAIPAVALRNAGSPDLVQVRHRGHPHRSYRRHQRIVVHPRGFAYPDYYATSRGFQDPGFAVRGNMPGCAVDLGYGRWESCDK